MDDQQYQHLMKGIAQKLLELQEAVCLLPNSPQRYAMLQKSREIKELLSTVKEV